MQNLPSNFFIVAGAYVVKSILDFTLDLIKHKESLRRTEADEQNQRREAADEREQNKLAAERERNRLEAADERERNRQEAADERERNRQAEHNEMLKKFEEEQNKAKAEHKQKMQTLLEHMNVLLMQQTHAQIGRERQIAKEIKQLNEKIEHEKRERQEAIRIQDIKFKSLVRTLVNAIKLFMNYYHQHQQQSSPMEYGMHHSRSQFQTSEYQERVRLLANFGLPEDSHKYLHDIFVKSCLSLEGIRAKEEGDAYFKEQKFEEAIKCYSQSIDELPTAAAYADRAMTYIKLNRFPEAEYDCTDALEIDDRYFKAYARRAMARTKLRFNLVGALQDVQVALKLETNTEEIKELCAQLMPLEGKLGGDAHEMEIRAQLMSWKAATEAKEEGNHYFKDEKFEDAIISYSVSINKSPTAAAYNNRAMAYIKLNKMTEAENDCTKVLEIDNQSFKAYAHRAIAREKLGDNIKGALEDVEAALKLEPDSREMEQLHGKLILDEYILSNN